MKVDSSIAAVVTGGASGLVGLGDVYKRQPFGCAERSPSRPGEDLTALPRAPGPNRRSPPWRR